MAVYLVRRSTRDGSPRYLVRLQEDATSPQVHLGSFKTKREAELRRQWALEEIASGRTPSRHAASGRGEPTLRAVSDAYLASRIDAAEKSVAVYRWRLSVACEAFGDRRVRDLHPRDVQAWLASLHHAPRSVRGFAHTLRAALDHATDDHPLRSAKLRLPRAERERVRLPTRGEIAAVVSELRRSYHKEAVGWLERGGFRIMELVRLEERDVDLARARVFVSRSKTPSGVRWVESLDHPDARLPLPADASALSTLRVVQGLSDNGLRKALAGSVRNGTRHPGACERAGVEPFLPHDLRHLHASRMLHDGVLSPAELAARLGHSSPAVTLGTYAHLVPPD